MGVYVWVRGNLFIIDDNWWLICQSSLPFVIPSHLSPPLSSCLLLTDGCPNLCNGNGQCTMGQQSWHCECQTGWRGPGCSVAMETSCADNKDNEGGELQEVGENIWRKSLKCSPITNTSHLLKKANKLKKKIKCSWGEQFLLGINKRF